MKYFNEFLSFVFVGFLGFLVGISFEHYKQDKIYNFCDEKLYNELLSDRESWKNEEHKFFNIPKEYNLGYDQVRAFIDYKFYQCLKENK